MSEAIRFYRRGDIESDGGLARCAQRKKIAEHLFEIVQQVFLNEDIGHFKDDFIGAALRSDWMGAIQFSNSAEGNGSR